MKQILIIRATTSRTVLVSFLLAIVSSGYGQFKVASGTSIIAAGNVQVVLSGLSLINAGTIKAPGATFYFSGNADNSITSTGNVLAVGNITINKLAGKQLFLNASLNIAGKINFISGNIELNGKSIDLDHTGSFEGESESSHVTGDSGGWISAYAILNAPNAANIGNLGAIITSPVNMDTVHITRRHQSISIASAGNKSIKRSFQIGLKNTSPNIALGFSYLDAELNSINENNLTQFKSSDGNSYSNKGYSTRNAVTNLVTKTGYTGINGFFTLSSLNAALPFYKEERNIDLKNSISEETAFEIFPNPVVNTLTVTLAGKSNSNGNIILYNVSGQQVMQQAIAISSGANQYHLNMSALAKGVYTLVVVQAGAVNRTVKIVKQ